MPLFHEHAPAKLNLYLHITGRTSDGYHDLDSLVVFTEFGDELTLEPAEDFSLTLEGPYAGDLKKEDITSNLITKAVTNLARLSGKNPGFHLTLIKQLPIASGIGGGSSDAASALRLVARFWGLHKEDPHLEAAAKPLGQDVPLCLKIMSRYITAEGSRPAGNIPRCPILLINPNKALPTPAVYKTYREGSFSFSKIASFEKEPKNLQDLINHLKERQNDLAGPAIMLIPEIKSILDNLQNSQGCLLSRMSGSGATCFGIYEDEASLMEAEAQIRADKPNWWIQKSFIPTSK